MPGFDDILGHEAVKEHFQKAIESHRISHAYILAGEAGMGRKSLAHAFALTLLCEKGGSQPCMECHACKQVLAGSHPDLIHVTHEKPATIGVDDIRKQVSDTIMIRPYSSYYKIYIIDEAEKMTPQAQNALLKTIEEPPSYAVIILLTTNPEAFLPTVLSRCVQLKLRPLRDSVVEEYLEHVLKIRESDARLCAAFARGNLGKAIRLANSGEFRHMYGELLDVLKRVKKMDICDLLNRIKGWKDEGMDLYECLDFMQIWYRDALMFKVTKDVDLLIFGDEYDAIEEMARSTGYDGFEMILQAIDKARTRLQANVNMELAMELMLLVMKEN